jgi:hypothetical protein
MAHVLDDHIWVNVFMILPVLLYRVKYLQMQVGNMSCIWKNTDMDRHCIVKM